MKKLCLLVLLWVSPLFADGLVFINYLGFSESFNSSVYVNLSGEDDIHLGSADWSGRSFTDSVYYAMKLEKWKENKGFGLEWVHHKIYLNTTTDQLTSFSISDGFNILYLNRVTPFKLGGKNSYLRLGAGFVFAHPDAHIAGRDRFYMHGGIGGSYFAGGALQIAVDKWVKEFSTHFMTVETKFTAAYSRPPISSRREEYAVVPNYAVHVILGLGNKPAKPKTAKEIAKTFGYPALYMGGVGHLIRRIDDLNKD